MVTSDTWSYEIARTDRVTKVGKGRRTIRYRVLIVCGDGNGQVGVGVGKSKDYTDAISKGLRESKKNIILFPLTGSKSIPYPVYGKFGGAKIFLRPAKVGTGIIAGGSPKFVLELAGIKNILTKRFGSVNSINNARAAIDGLTRVAKFNTFLKEKDV